jgi:endoglucanase
MRAMNQGVDAERSSGRRLAGTSFAALVLAVACTAGAAPRAASSATSFLPAAGTAAVRVNQVGYDLAGPKRAYLMASATEAGATFAVKDEGGTTVFFGPVGPPLGQWSSSFPFVYALDFDAVQQAGSFTVSVTGPVPATSPTFGIDTGQNLYAHAVANGVAFYQVQRDGPDFIPSPLRTDPAHLNDADAMTYLTPKVNENGEFRGDLTPLGVRIDASGGWWDAGDYPKFVETTNYTIAMQLAGVRDFPAQMGTGAGAGDFTAEARFGTEWLLRMWDSGTRTLYYQVGIGAGNRKTAGDHDLWRLPQEDDTYGGTRPVFRYIRHRPVFRAAPSGSLISPNLAGRNAAVFGTCYQVFASSDPALAHDCLVSGQQMFDLADTSPSGDLLTVIPFGFYPEVEWQSDMELGAVELYFAAAGGNLPPGLPHRDPRFYLRRAAHWAYEYIHGPNANADTLNMYDVSGFAHYELYRAIEQAGDPPGLQITKADLLESLKAQLDGALTQAATDPFGFGFPWAAYDTTTHGAGLSVMASEYDELTGTNTYAAYSRRWLANILGANAWGSSFIVGDGSTFPFCTQHQVANIVGSLHGEPPILAGAAVEGPNTFAASGTLEGMRKCPPDGVDVFKPFNGHGSVYKDNVQSYSTVEPAIDLTASSPLAFARQMAGRF